MNLKSKLLSVWNFIKDVIQDSFLFSSTDKYYKDLLHVNRHINPQFNRFLTQYNYISFVAIFLGFVDLGHQVLNSTGWNILISVLLIWMIYVARIKGLSYLAKFFSYVSDNDTEFKKPKGE